MALPKDATAKPHQSDTLLPAEQEASELKAKLACEEQARQAAEEALEDSKAEMEREGAKARKERARLEALLGDLKEVRCMYSCWV